MKRYDEFQKEYIERITNEGYELNPLMFNRLKKDLYIEWLECKYSDIEPVEEVCEWTRALDDHFNIGCVGENGERGNAHFKKDKMYTDTKWDFKYCPYCGNPIRAKG